MFDLNYRAGSTPLAARSNGIIYASLLVALVIFVIVGIIAFILRKYKEKITSKEYIEKEKNRPTKYSDIKKLKTKYDYTPEEAALLWEVCKATEPPNIFYLIRDNAKIDQIFREAYGILKDIGTNDKKMCDFYKLRYKMEKTLAHVTKLSSTLGIPVNSKVFYIDAEGEQYPFTLRENTKDAMTLEIPDFFVNHPRKPQELKKVKFMYCSPTFMTYFFASRPIRYTQANDGKYLMVISHSNNLFSQNQRNSRREFVKDKCEFSSVKVVTDKKNNNHYQSSEKHYPAYLLNVSAGGCCIHTTMPIKEKQLICLRFPSLGVTEDVIGIIRHTRKIPEKQRFALHIQFTEISLNTQNKIYSYVYKFEI